MRGRKAFSTILSMGVVLALAPALFASYTWPSYLPDGTQPVSTRSLVYSATVQWQTGDVPLYNGTVAFTSPGWMGTTRASAHFLVDGKDFTKSGRNPENGFDLRRQCEATAGKSG